MPQANYLEETRGIAKAPAPEREEGVRVRIVNVHYATIDSAFSFRLYRRWADESAFELRFLTFATVFAVLMTLGCGTPQANLDITAPATVTAGTPFTITVTTMYGGKRDTVINSFVQFTSSDEAAALPPDYLFTSADAGSHTFPNGVTLKTPGSQTITATVNMATGITGTVRVAVSSASLTRSGASPTVPFAALALRFSFGALVLENEKGDSAPYRQSIARFLKVN